ncbi:unnamed protein product [Thelazia callipaeda]|uniref:Tetraspanin n=1 Tax=Thelazia callipaeda TaxID=103827 RepID=A0A0N5CPY0_THECL|nr:unnamed protein product [Thelazia callipaeda]
MKLAIAVSETKPELRKYSVRKASAVLASEARKKGAIRKTRSMTIPEPKSEPTKPLEVKEQERTLPHFRPKQFSKAQVLKNSKSQLQHFKQPIKSTNLDLAKKQICVAQAIFAIYFCQLLLCGSAIIICIYTSLKFVPYHLKNGQLSASFSGLKLVKYESSISVVTTLANSFILIFLCNRWQEPIKTNILYSISQAITDSDYAQDVNIIQQQFKCCGILVQGISDPQKIWLRQMQVDVAFPHNLYRHASCFSKMGSLPWSCCRSDFQFMRCDHFAYERFVIPFNETNFIQVPSYAARFKKEWECSTLGQCIERRLVALSSVYDSDCAQAFYQEFKVGFFYLNGGILLLIGSLMFIGMVSIALLELISKPKK